MLGARKILKGVLYTSDIKELPGYYAKFCSLNLMARAIFPSDVNIAVHYHMTCLALTKVFYRIA